MLMIIFLTSIVALSFCIPSRNEMIPLEDQYAFSSGVQFNAKFKL